MPREIQTQFINEQNGTAYYEIYFSNLSEFPISISDFQMIERIIELEICKIRKRNNEDSN